MARYIRFLIIVFVFVSMFIYLMIYSDVKKAFSYNQTLDGVLFSGESNAMYFLDTKNATIYRYDTQGRMTRKYVIKELGKDLESR